MYISLETSFFGASDGAIDKYIAKIQIDKHIIL